MSSSYNIQYGNTMKYKSGRLALCFAPGWLKRGRCLHLWGAEHPLSFLPCSLHCPLLHSQSLYVAFSRWFGGPRGTRSEVTVAPCCFWRMRLVVGMMGWWGVCWVRGTWGKFWRVVTGWGADLGFAGATHHRGGRDNSQDPPTWVGSLPGD